MKRFLVIFSLIVVTLCSMISCGKSDEVPDGLQIVDENVQGGYVFYGPEGWTVSNRTGISACYVSPINNTSITFTEAEMPKVALSEYFRASFANAPYEINLLKEGEACNFGNAKEAYKFVYTFTVDNYELACMQILVKNDGRFFIFTYSSYGKVDDESSDYRTYLEAVLLAIDNFKFTEVGEGEVADYPVGEDGYMLVSDKDVCGFDLYVPKGLSVVDSSAIVTVKLSDGANVSLTKATGTGVSISDYWQNRLKELELYVGSVTEISINQVNGDGKPEIKLGDLDPAKVASYEYTYEFGGRVYHVYQVMGVDAWNGYVFTYTALDGEYAEHLEAVSDILGRIKF